jgi:hypothetical protein
LYFTPLLNEKRIDLSLGIYPLLFKEFMLFLVSNFELLPNEQLPLIVLLFGLFSVRYQLLLRPLLLLLVLFNLLLFGHENSEPFLFDVFLGFDSLLHFLVVRHFFDLLHLDFLHVLNVVFILEHFDVPSLLPGFFDFLAGSRHLVLEHAHPVSEELTVFLHLLPDSSSLGVSQIF